MPRFCAIINCSNRANRDNKSFFRLPQIYKRNNPQKIKLSIERRASWLNAIRRKDLEGKRLSWIWVCEEHFISGKPCDIEDINNPDWAPSLKLGYVRISPTSYRINSEDLERAENNNREKGKTQLSSCLKLVDYAKEKVQIPPTCSRLVGHIKEEEDIQVSPCSRLLDYTKEKEIIQMSSRSKLVDSIKEIVPTSLSYNRLVQPTKEVEDVHMSSYSKLVDFIKEIVPPLPSCYRLLDHTKEMEDIQTSSCSSLGDHTKETVEVPSLPASSDSFLTNSDFDTGRSNFRTAKIFIDNSQMTNLTASDILKLEKENTFLSKKVEILEKKLLMVLKNRCSKITDKDVLCYTGLPDKKLLNLWLSEDL